jgi:hypothetical protein
VCRFYDSGGGDRVRPRLKLFRQKVLSGHQLAVLRARKTSLRCSNLTLKCLKALSRPPNTKITPEGVIFVFAEAVRFELTGL